MIDLESVSDSRKQIEYTISVHQGRAYFCDSIAEKEEECQQDEEDAPRMDCVHDCGDNCCHHPNGRQ